MRPLSHLSCQVARQHMLDPAAQAANMSITVIPPVLHPSLRVSPYYTASSDSLTFQAQTHRSRTANADENREKLVSVIKQLYNEAVPAETSSDKHAKYKEVTKRFHDSRLKDKKIKGSKKQSRRGGDM
ncbi:hypothetical protein HC256_002489 [Beauveria bassiana]|nr:hypothetical protein HC256_002489 [Beauveria bassiana]